jgi:hypothetical protein
VDGLCSSLAGATRLELAAFPPCWRDVFHSSKPNPVHFNKKAHHLLDGLCSLLAGATRLELAASGVTGRRYNQLNYAPEIEMRLHDFSGSVQQEIYLSKNIHSYPGPP